MADSVMASCRDAELAHEFIDWVATEVAEPPAGWEASVEEHQLIVIYTHLASHWRKYPEPGDLTPTGADWMCADCTYPKRWGARRCWWCDQQRGINVADAPWDYGVGFRPHLEGALHRRADPADPGQLADPDPEHLSDDDLNDGDDFARVMGLGS